MSYAQVFGGGTINPAQRTYAALSFSTDIQLQWPIEQQIGGNNVVADIIDLSAAVPGLNVDLSDARQVSNGFTALFNNIGAETTTIRDIMGGTIISLSPGEAWFVYLRDNSTEAGIWRTFQLGASVSVANASALAGAGLKAISATLNQTMPVTSTATTPTDIVDSDRARMTIWTGGVGVFDLPEPATVGNDWFTAVRNEGSGNLTVTPPSGDINSTTSLVMAPGTSALIVTDGTNFFTIGLSSASTAGFDFVELDVSGSGDFVLSGVNLNRIVYRFVGTLTGNRNIIVPNTIQEYWVANETSGAFTLSVKTAAQITPVDIVQGGRNILYSDGNDVIAAESNTVSFPIPVAQGGTGATTAGGAATNLSLVPNSRTVASGTGLTGGGNLSANRTIALDTANTRNVDHASVSISSGTGLTGGGTIAANRTLSLDTANSRNVDHAAVSVIAGNGLSGGGTIAADRTLTVGAGDGISVAATTVAVDATVVRTSGNQTIAGNKTLTGTTLISTLPRSTGSSPSGGTIYARTANTTIPTAATGDVLSIYNNSASSITLTQGSGLTLRLAGTTTTGSRTLAARGFATIWYNSASEAIAIGAGLS